MATTYGHKPYHHLPEWRGLAGALNASAAGACLACDLRNNTDRDPYIYHFAAATALNRYNPITDEWQFLGSPAMGIFAAGTGVRFVPSAGPNGTLAAGWSTTAGALTTALPAAVGINQLANRGDGTGYKVRITGNAAGSSGKTEERNIVANTAGTTPTITLDSALSFTPASGDRYEFLSGRVFLMATAATIFKFYDVATNSYSAALNVTNLTAPAVDNEVLALDELYVPTGRAPGAGYFGNLVSSGTGATSITGPVGGADASQAVDEWKNRQIRVVTDATAPTAVGQRKKITANTAANPTVYTVDAWDVTPTVGATFVIENIGDLVAFTGSASALSHTYAAGGWRADGAWSTGATAGAASLQIPNRPANTAAGITGCFAFGMTALDTAKNIRYSGVYLIRGGAVATIDCLDLATLSWSTGIGGTAIAYGGSGATFTTGTCSRYDPVANAGRRWYINQSGLQRFLYFDVLTRTLVPWADLPNVQSTAVVGEKLALVGVIDGATKGTYILHLINTGTLCYEVLTSV